MRYSTVAAAAAIFFGVAIAVPQKVVTEIEIVTITSCAPEVPDCPAHTSTSTTVYIEPTPETTPCAEETSIYTPPIYPNSTSIDHVCPGHPSCPSEETSIYVCPGHPSCPSEETSVHPEPTYVPTGTGSPYPPANTSTPVVPTSPPEYTGSAIKLGASFAAVLGAVALAILA